LDKSDIETFLSPEEEEALLSLYSEESKEEKETDNESLKSSESDMTIEKIKKTKVEGVKTALPEMLEQIDSEPEIIEANKDLPGTVDS
jgi:hypothetical protein